MQLSQYKLKEIPVIPQDTFEELCVSLRASYQKLADNDFEDYLSTEDQDEIEEIYKSYEDDKFSHRNIDELEDASNRLMDFVSDLGGLIKEEERNATSIYDLEPIGDTCAKRPV